MRTLSIDDVLMIHARVARDARRSDEPIALMHGTGIEASVKDRGLLESAASRQFAGTTNGMLYKSPMENAATLMYGLAKNHAFYDGNKRTALVSLLNHLDRNHLSLVDLRWHEVESMVLELVVGELPLRPRLRHVVAGVGARADRDFRALVEWIRQNCREVQRGERRMTYDELNTIIRRHGYEFANPDGSSIPIVKLAIEQKRNILGRKREVRVRSNVGSIGFPGWKREVGITDVKRVRKFCRLTEENGVDSAAFYDEAMRLDEIVNRYRQVLRSLANK